MQRLFEYWAIGRMQRSSGPESGLLLLLAVLFGASLFVVAAIVWGLRQAQLAIARVTAEYFSFVVVGLLVAARASVARLENQYDPRLPTAAAVIGTVATGVAVWLALAGHAEQFEPDGFDLLHLLAALTMIGTAGLVSLTLPAVDVPDAFPFGFLAVYAAELGLWILVFGTHLALPTPAWYPLASWLQGLLLVPFAAGLAFAAWHYVVRARLPTAAGAG